MPLNKQTTTTGSTRRLDGSHDEILDLINFYRSRSFTFWYALLHYSGYFGEIAICGPGLFIYQGVCGAGPSETIKITNQLQQAGRTSDRLKMGLGTQRLGLRVFRVLPHGIIPSMCPHVDRRTLSCGGNLITA
jgi:hypothetical protein